MYSSKEQVSKQNGEEDEELSLSLVGDNQVIRVVGRPSLLSHKSRPGGKVVDSWIVGLYSLIIELAEKNPLPLKN